MALQPYVVTSNAYNIFTFPFKVNKLSQVNTGVVGLFPSCCLSLQYQKIAQKFIKKYSLVNMVKYENLHLDIIDIIVIRINLATHSNFFTAVNYRFMANQYCINSGCDKGCCHLVSFFSLLWLPTKRMQQAFIERMTVSECCNEKQLLSGDWFYVIRAWRLLQLTFSAQCYQSAHILFCIQLHTRHNIAHTSEATFKWTSTFWPSSTDCSHSSTLSEIWTIQYPCSKQKRKLLSSGSARRNNFIFNDIKCNI